MLPNESGWYLTYSANGTIRTRKFNFVEDRWIDTMIIITHWMPLPNNPK